MMLYLILVQPFSKKIDNYILFCNEITLLVFYFYLSACEIHLCEIDSMNSAIIIIRIVLVTLCFNIASNFVKMIQHIVDIIKSRCFHRNIKTFPTDNVVSVEKF